MATFKIVILHLCCAGWDIVAAWPMVLAIRLLWGRDLRWEDRRLKCELKAGSFPITNATTATGFWKWWTRWPRGWYLNKRGTPLERSWGGTSVGNGQFYGPGNLAPKGEPPTATMIHEDHHTLQARASAVRATFHALVLVIVLLALGSPWAALWVGLAMWIFGGNLSESGGGWTASWLDGGDPYFDSAHEVGARGVDGRAR